MIIPVSRGEIELFHWLRIKIRTNIIRKGGGVFPRRDIIFFVISCLLTNLQFISRFCNGIDKQPW